jgi:Transport and Golgi organisation 2
MPLLLLGFRDEFTGRVWRPPARHWPGSPLVGGRDEEAGGTWLALHPDLPRVSCLLNGRVEQPPPPKKPRSRGELPLLAAADGEQALKQLQEDHATLTDFNPFFLICADPTSVLMLSWDGTRAALEDLGPGTHLITNTGHTYPSAAEDDKARHFGPRFAAYRPDADPAAAIPDAWGEWITLACGDNLPGDDPAAIIARRNLPDGRLWGTTSVSLVALGADRLRYDFQPVPADPVSWYSVGLPARLAHGRRGARPSSANIRSVSRKNVNRLTSPPDTSCTSRAQGEYPPAGSGLYCANAGTPLTCPAGTTIEPAHWLGIGSSIQRPTFCAPRTQKAYGGIVISASSASSVTSCATS